ncbi:hypothetical protein ACH42_17285 [Endozoicomonas sp. (ex Bugula neritina AB1)]|nr:hypothetical protein ACH42_17285 [Endozoicomonas sp. (ex Bugula neritina AB1)]
MNTNVCSTKKNIWIKKHGEVLLVDTTSELNKGDRVVLVDHDSHDGNSTHILDDSNIHLVIGKVLMIGVCQF